MLCLVQRARLLDGVRIVYGLGTDMCFAAQSTMNLHSFSYHRHGSVAGSAMAASSLHGNDDV